jgi:hypothetical protein
VSTLARSQGIEQETPYTLLFSPNNDTYVLDVEGRSGEKTTTFGTYTWSMNESFRSSEGGGGSTSQSILSLKPIWRAVGMDNYPIPEEDVISGMVIAKDRNVATFSSPLGIATFDITPLVGVSSTKVSKFRQ